MNKMTRRIMVSVLTLVLTVVALGTTTFAWFSLSNVGTVGNIEGEVIAGEGLEIRYSYEDEGTKYTSWRNSFEFDGAHFPNLEFNAVNLTNPGDVTNDVLGLFKMPTITDNVIKFDQTNAIENNEYLKLDIQFRTKKENAKVDLTSVTFSEDESIDYSVLDDITTGIEAGLKSKNLPLRVTLGTETYRIDDSYDKDAQDGVEKNGMWTFLEGKGVDFNGATPVEAHGSVFANKQLDVATTPGVVDGDYFIYSTTVYIWVDGWDIHAFDVIFSQVLGSVELKFELQA